MSETLEEQLRTICDHLVERTASLFLGSGINAGIRAMDGDQVCPLGNQLSELICSELLGSPETKVPLDESSEMARFAFGDRDRKSVV